MPRFPLTPARKLLLEERARRMRHAPELSEALLWSELRGRKLGVQFRRQVPLAGKYIVDFLAPSLRLVVEVDGGYHAQREAADARRDSLLHRLGYRVLRLPAQLVERDLPEAVARVRAAIAAGA